MPNILNLSGIDIQTIKKVSKSIGRLNLSFGINGLSLKSYWCRIALLYEERCGTELHGHSFYELHMCLCGRCTIELNGKQINLNQNEFVLIPPGIKHRIISLDGNYTEFVWGFTCRTEEEHLGILLKAFGKSTEVIAVRAVSSIMLECLNVILTCGNTIDEIKYDVIKCQLYCMFKLIYGEYSTDGSAEDFYKRYPDDHILKAVKKFIYDNPSLNLKADEIAAQCSISKSRLGKICLQGCGMTVSALKNRIKCEIISKLLTESNLTLSEIAERTGFSDEFTMNKFFKRNEGMPPGQYRKSFKRV